MSPSEHFGYKPGQRASLAPGCGKLTSYLSLVGGGVGWGSDFHPNGHHPARTPTPPPDGLPPNHLTWSRPLTLPLCRGHTLLEPAGRQQIPVLQLSFDRNS